MTNPVLLHKQQNSGGSSITGKVLPVAEWESLMNDEHELVLGLRLLLESMSILAAAQATRAQAAASLFTPLIEAGKNNLKVATKKLEAYRSGGDANVLSGYQPGPLENHPQKEEISYRAQKLAAAYHENYPDRANDAPLTKSEALKLMDYIASNAA